MSQRLPQHFPSAAVLFVLPVALSTGWLASCSSEPTDPEATVTYHAAVRPILDARCVSCHHNGGPAPFSMEYTADDWKNGKPTWAESAVGAALDGRMPPWLPSGDCRDLAYERVLSDEEKQALTTWRDEGFAQGDPELYNGPLNVETPPDLGSPALELQPAEAYTPNDEESDDYRCFILPTSFDKDTFVTATNIVPGDTQMVHHGLLYLVPPDGVANAEKLDKSDDGPGYTCFGGPGGTTLSTLGGWVPGAVIAPTPENSAIFVPAGSKIVLQIHYNTLALNGAPPPAEKSTVQIWTTAAKPAYRVESLPMAHLGMKVPSGEEASVQERVFQMPVDGTIISLAPHMHLLGAAIEASFEPEGADAACMIQIPEWDFHWQQMYGLGKDARLEAKKGDKIRLKCTYNNSAANQPMVGGSKKAPEDVYWGEGTLDEMCLLYVATMVPFDTPDFRCGAYPSCVEKCGDGDGRCFFDCATVGGGQCAGCLISAVAKCAPPYCASQGIAVQQCNQTCSGDGAGCILYDCKEEFDAFYACMEPHLEGGDCATQLAACGL
ncbi:MAG: hypothetical protein IPK82_32805 [Polyangiaceae bacterium]|nr:hypothetical protein [Polyangiaceae bacterium]